MPTSVREDRDRRQRFQHQGPGHDGGHGVDGVAFDAFYQEYAARLHGLVRCVGTPAHAVDDIVQETLWRAYRMGVHEDVDREPWPWLAAVARHLAIDARRLRHVRDERLPDGGHQVSITASNLVGDPETVAVATDRYSDVARALRELDDRYQRVLLLKHVEGLKYGEIAAVEGMSVDALKSVLVRARRRFRETYTEIVDARSVSAVFAVLFGPLARRLRLVRDRAVTTGGQAAASISEAAASVPGLANAVATVAVLGSLAVAPALAADPSSETSDSVASPLAFPMWDPSVDLATLGMLGAQPADDASSSSGGDSEAEGPGDVATSDGGTTGPDGGSSGGSEIPPVSVDGEGVRVSDEGTGDWEVNPGVDEQPNDDGSTSYSVNPVSRSADPDGDGVEDGHTSTGAGLNCPPPEERGTVMDATCSTLEDGGTSVDTSAPLPSDDLMG